MDYNQLTDAELIKLYRKTHREVTELDSEGCGKGYGANLIPYMNLIPKDLGKAPPEVVASIFCPGKNGKNAFVSMPDPRQQLTQRVVEVVAGLTDNETAARVATRIATTPTADTNLSMTQSEGGY